MCAARPNAAHLALARMEQSGHVAGVITQNVDGLHHAAGSSRVVELHGSLAVVCCTECGRRVSRVFEDGDVLLVTGSSLTVYSGRRFVYRACRDDVPVAVINRGPTRADDVAAAKVEGALGTVLPALADALG